MGKINKYANIYNKDGNIIRKLNNEGMLEDYTMEELEKLVDELGNDKDENNNIRDKIAFNNASKMLAVALVIAYVSSLGAAVFSVLTGNVIIPYLSIASSVGDLKVLPEVVFKLDIPQIMGVMSALVFSLLVGLAATWTRAVTVINLLDEFQEIVLKIVTNTVAFSNRSSSE